MWGLIQVKRKGRRTGRRERTERGKEKRNARTQLTEKKRLIATHQQMMMKIMEKNKERVKIDVLTKLMVYNGKQGRRKRKGLRGLRLSGDPDTPNPRPESLRPYYILSMAIVVTQHIMSSRIINSIYHNKSQLRNIFNNKKSLSKILISQYLSS
jgi:hypothetical protein